MEMVGMKHYDGVEGFGAISRDELSQLAKALTAGADINNPGAAPGVGFPLRVESLEKTLKNVTFTAEHIKLWRAITKDPAFNTVEEFNVLSSYGAGRDGAFVSEGALPEEDDSTYERKTAIVKFMGTTRKVSHVMTMINPAHGQIIAGETVNGTMHLLQQVERALFYADSALSSLQFDGLQKLITSLSPSTNVIDMRGAPLDEDVLMDITLRVFSAPNFGKPTHLHSNPMVINDIAKGFTPKARYDLFDKDSGMVGLNVDGFTSQAGPVKFEANTFIDEQNLAPTSAVGDSSKRPGSPTISTGATTPANTSSKFGADDAGSYFYKIVACNDFGKSAAVAVDASAIAVAAGDKMTFGVTPAAAGVKWYELYRSKVGGLVTATSLIDRIANTSGAGAQTVNDLNETLPFTSVAFLLQQNREAFTWKQLAPMLKIPLAVVDANIRWMQLLYGVLMLYAPGKVAMIKNIGRAPNSKAAFG